jgi:hypothetical protein
MNTYQKILQTRIRSGERAALIALYASEKGIRLSAAWTRIYKLRDRLDRNGDLIPKSRSDKGICRLSGKPYNLEAIPRIKQLLENKELTYVAIAKQLDLPLYFVRRVERAKSDS